MRLCVLDTETSSIDATTGHLVEIAVAKFRVERASFSRTYSTLVQAPSNDAERVNKIPPDMLTSEDAIPRADVMRAIVSFVSDCDAIVAHNADFDRAWLPELHHKHWICSCDDIEWPNAGHSRSLSALCIDHGGGVVDAHRAIDDVLTLLRLFRRVAERHDLKPIVERAMRPKAVYEVTAKGYDEARNALAKELGFRWDAPTKSWRRKIAIEDAGAIGERLPIQQVTA